MKKICEFDGVEFDAKRATAKFCPPPKTCRQQAARAAGYDENGEAIDVTLKAETPYTPGMKVPKPAEVTLTLADNPFAADPDPEYDVEAALKAFKTMGRDKTNWITTGIAAFDKLTRIPRGRVTQIQGPYAVGKTTLCLNMIAGLKGKKVLYIDSEASLNPSLLVSLRVDPKTFTLWNKSAYIEDIYDVIKEAAQSGKYDMIVFDSLASCTSKNEEEGKATDRQIGQKPLVVNKMMRVVPAHLRDTDTALVIINQEREVIGSYVPQKYTPGGMGVPYAASLMVALKTIPSWRFGRTATDTKAKKFIGHKVQATIIKSKVNTPHRVAEFNLYYPDPIEDDDSEALF